MHNSCYGNFLALLAKRSKSITAIYLADARRESKPPESDPPNFSVNIEVFDYLAEYTNEKLPNNCKPVDAGYFICIYYQNNILPGFSFSDVLSDSRLLELNRLSRAHALLISKISDMGFEPKNISSMFNNLGSRIFVAAHFLIKKENDINFLFKMGFKPKNISSILSGIGTGYKNIEVIIDTLVKMENDIRFLFAFGFEPKNISSILNGICSGTKNCLAIETTFNAIFKSVISLIELGFEPKNISGMFHGLGDRVAEAAEAVLRKKDAIKYLINVGFTTRNVSRMLSGIRCKDFEDTINDVFLFVSMLKKNKDVVIDPKSIIYFVKSKKSDYKSNDICSLSDGYKNHEIYKPGSLN